MKAVKNINYRFWIWLKVTSCFKCQIKIYCPTDSYRAAQNIAFHSQKYRRFRSVWNDSAYLFITGPCPAPIPPAGAPLLGLWSCPPPAGAEMEAGAPAAGTAPPGCPGWPSPSRLASFPIVPLSETAEKDEICWWASDRGLLKKKLRENSAQLLFRHHHLQSSILGGARARAPSGRARPSTRRAGSARGSGVNALVS